MIALRILALAVITTLTFVAFSDASPAWWNQFSSARYAHYAKANAEKATVGTGTQYTLGVGIADVTGPVAEIEFMGYASLTQVGTGLRQRLRSRAFLIGDATNQAERFVYVTADICMGDTAIRKGVLDNLQQMYGGLYNENNFALVGTHSHSGPAGWLNYLLPTITSLGFDHQSYQAIVDGVTLSVKRAHDNAKPGYLSYAVGELLDTNINRSPSAYLENPQSERDMYQYDQDKNMTALRFDDVNGNPMGVLNWFAVHGTSMYNNNTKATGDNKGLAAYYVEQDANSGALPGNGTFVAGFSQANVGDTSPNTLGAVCADTGLPCDFKHSTCNGKNEMCIGRGPGFRISDAESNRLIALNQSNMAQQLYKGSSRTPIAGGVKSLHTFVDMSQYSFTTSNGTNVTTCPAALGYSFAAGTTDGPGAFDFTQADNSSQPQNPFWEIVKAGISQPSPQQIKCQAPKPILLNIGEINIPYKWGPAIVDVQMFRVGQMVMLVMPGEFTTMAGRRIRAAISKAVAAMGIQDPIVVLGGPANTYTHYVTTVEEYSEQRYEGASTLFGPWTHEAYVNLYTGLVSYLADNATASPPPGPSPPIYTNVAKSLVPPVIADNPPLLKKFGDVLTDVQATYSAGQNVSARFVGANPRNNLRLEGTFLSVDQQQSDGSWKTIRTDSDWSTQYDWLRTNTALGYSEVTLSWVIEPGTSSGTYRLGYFGDAKSLIGGGITSFTGYSSSFKVQ